MEQSVEKLESSALLLLLLLIFIAHYLTDRKEARVVWSYYGESGEEGALSLYQSDRGEAICLNLNFRSNFP